MLCPFNDLQPASFRGVEFWVRSDKESYGRRIVTHEYPLRDDPYNEDLGEKAQTYSVTGYVWGDTATLQKEIVVAACRIAGSAILQLPAKVAFMAVCKSLNVSRSKDEIGYFELQFEFVADPGFGMLPMLGSPFESLVSAVATVAITALTRSFSHEFSTKNSLPYVMNNATARVVTFADLVLAQFEAAARSSNDSAPIVVTSAIGLAQNAQAIVRPGPSDPPSSEVVATIGNMFDHMGQALDPITALELFKGFARFSPYESVNADGVARYGLTGLLSGLGVSGFDLAQTPSASELQDQKNAAAFNGMVRSFALIAFAKAITATSFTSRRQAIQVRADLVELFDEQLQRTIDEQVTAALLDVRDYAVKSLSSLMTSLIPVVTVEATVSLPSLYWASRLYDDATRAQELSDRNNVASPAFMPSRFEALTS